jgi:hypothetical protein
MASCMIGWLDLLFDRLIGVDGLLFIADLFVRAFFTIGWLVEWLVGKLVDLLVD